MPKRGENIYKRKDGRWEARYIKAYDLSGKIRYGSCYGKTYTEAKEKANKIKAALLNNKLISTTDDHHRFLYFCDQWLWMQKSRVKSSTYARYDTALERHIKPALGGFFPLALNTQAVESFKQALLEERLASKTVKDILVILRSVLIFTAKQFPNGFPAIEIKYPREVKKEVRVLSVEEQKRFSSYLQQDLDCCKFGVLLALMTGLRLGELCALRWENISMCDRTLQVSATIQRLPCLEDNTRKTQLVIGSPKSDTSSRIIPLPEGAIRLCNAIGVRKSTTYLLTGTNCYMEPRTLQYRMQKYLKDCNLERVHFHTLRHTFATRCVEAGFEIKSLSEILGHSSTGITMERYVHSSIELKRANMDKLSAVGF